MTEIQPLLITLSTVCTTIMIGLGFLPHPSRESAIWATAFTLAMVGTYVDAAAGSLGATWLAGIAAGFNVAGIGLIWVGIRVRVRRRRVQLVPTLIVSVMIGVALAFSTDTAAQPVVMATRLALVAALSAAVVLELVAVRAPQRITTLPLIVGAGLIGTFALFWLVTGVTRLSIDGASAVLLAAPYTPAATVIVLVTALVTLLLLVRVESPPTEGNSRTSFRAVATDRLARAERFDDAWWSILDVRLDDPNALSEASGPLAYTRVLDRFDSDVSAIVPAEADLDRVDPTRMLVLLPRHEAAVRPVLRALLERVATISSDQSVDLRLSASIGWASVSLIGYDLDDLIAAASAAADEAQLAGGDRWERANIII